jgi:hypothetical protein
MSFSCDLVENARKHKWFLEKLHELGVTVDKPSAESLYRYQHLWLPLVHHHPRQPLMPPPDIAWLWHCHRLAPKNYVAYVKQTFGGMVEANPPFALQIPGPCEERSVVEATRVLWKKTYSDESFFFAEQQASATRGKADPLCGFDLLSSTERQATFLWQVSGERFQDDDFLEEGVDNYTKFLKLKQKASDERIILVPTYQIDLLWHTHILSSITNYNNDCKAIMGGTLHHDDSLTDRSDGGVLDVAYTSTKNLWKDEYGCDYVICGGMYRGEPPKAFFSADWRSWQEEWQAGANLHLIGKMGASSTSPPDKWAHHTGTASDGAQAFIATNTSRKDELKTKEHRDAYVLGRTANGIGYYHMETRDAHEILHQRVVRRIKRLETDIACAQCCFLGNKPMKEKELAQMTEVRDVLAARKKASKPSGNPRNTSSGDDTYYGADGLWLYPFIMYDCAGGACGGGVAGTGCGGSACGAGACGGSAYGGKLSTEREMHMTLLLTDCFFSIVS